MKRYKTYKRDLFPLAAAAISAAACAAFLIYSGEAAEAVRRGINICGVSVIPSLFPMMFLAQYMIKSGAAELAGSLLEKPTRALFGLPGICGIALMTAFIGGYPAGARAAESLTDCGAISRREGERLANIAFCSGPGFAIGMVGAGLYNNQSVGMLILTAQAISCIMIGIVYNIACGLRHSSPHKRTEDDIRHTAIARSHDAFVTAAADTASTMLGMCSFIILFQVITSVLDAAGINQALGRLSQSAHFGDTGEYLLPCITEVTGGSIISVKAGLPLTAFVMGFGGLSVHFQNFALCRTIRPRKWLYILTRLVQGILCSLLVSLALRLPCFASVSVPAAKTVIDSVPAEFSQVSTGFGCTMLVMCLMSVICLPQSRKESY